MSSLKSSSYCLYKRWRMLFSWRSSLNSVRPVGFLEPGFMSCMSPASLLAPCISLKSDLTSFSWFVTTGSGRLLIPGKLAQTTSTAFLTLWQSNFASFSGAYSKICPALYYPQGLLFCGVCSARRACWYWRSKESRCFILKSEIRICPFVLTRSMTIFASKLASDVF